MDEPACPSCGAPIAFRSAVGVYAVCRSCGSTVLRTDGAVAAIGRMAALPADVSPIQIGTQLAWRGTPFTVLGRIRTAWQDGAWNEWFLDGGGQPAWLAEAQGFLSIAFDAPVPAGLAGAPPALGSRLTVEGQVFGVADIKQAVCVGSEGELPFAAPHGRGTTYVDLVGAGGGFAGLEISPDGQRFFLGQYAPFHAFGFRNLRGLDGWAVPDPAADRSGDPGAA